MSGPTPTPTGRPGGPSDRDRGGCLGRAAGTIEAGRAAGIGTAGAGRAAGANGVDRYALRRLVGWATRRLAEAGVASPAHDARALAEHLLGRPVLLADGAGPEFTGRYRALVERRADREPLQHITERMWFRGLELVARPGVFIVRPETEVVAGAAIEAIRAAGRRDTAAGAWSSAAGGAGGADSGAGGAGGAIDSAGASGVNGAGGAGAGAPVVVDLCTGSGAIAAAVAAEVPGSRVIAVELDDAATRLAAENFRRLVPGRVELVRADATAPTTLAGLDGRVDVVVANPPYVPAGAVEDVETAVHDPALALYGGGADGLEVPVAVIGRAAALLRAGGVLVMEHDAGQGAALRAAALAAGFASARTGQDLTRRDRYLQAER